jgi:hypothetical protein
MFRSMQDPTELTISGNFNDERMVGEPRRDGERCQPDGARQDEEKGELVADGDSHCGAAEKVRESVAFRGLGVPRQEESTSQLTSRLDSHSGLSERCLY